MDRSGRDNVNSQTALRHEADGSKDIGEAQWRAKLTPKQYSVLRQKGTDMAHTGEYDEFFGEGVYVCAGCDTPLYTSNMKWNCGCGWPGFWTNLPKAVREEGDADGYRVEILCNACNGHLGHVFRGERFRNPAPNERHCVNSTSIRFIPSSEVTFEVPALESFLPSLGAPAPAPVPLAAPVSESKSAEAPSGAGTQSAEEELIAKLISENPVVVFSKTYCPYCTSAKQTLTREGARYLTIELDTRDDGQKIQAALASLTGRRSVPNVFVSGTSIGGGDDTVALSADGRLHTLLESAGAL